MDFEKNLNVVSLNMNSWCPINRTLSYKGRIMKASSHLKKHHPHIVCLQEFMPGKDSVNLIELKKQFPGYSLITPFGFDCSSHPRSLVCVTLLSNFLFCDPVALDVNTVLPNRICLTKAHLVGTTFPVFIHNLHAVDTRRCSTRTYDREELSKDLWNASFSSARDVALGASIFVGDFQEASGGVHCKRLQRLGYSEPPINYAACYRSSNPRLRSDHIFYSGLAQYKFNPKTYSIDYELTGYLTDHCTVIASTKAS